MLVLGVNAYHGDSSACLLEDGRIVAMAEEERFRRIKHWAGSPSRAVAAVLAAHGARMSEMDYIAVNRDPGANFGRKISYALRSPPGTGLVLDRLRNRRRVLLVAARLAADLGVDDSLPRTSMIEHHLCHVASSFLVSPYEEAAVLSVDGFGDFASAAWGIGRGADVQIRGRVFFPHSLGIFYTALTQYLGFPVYGDEYKVMGLAPYGEPRFVEPLGRVLRIRDDGTFELNLHYFRHQTSQLSYRWENSAPTVDDLFTAELEKLLGPRFVRGDNVDQRRCDLACSVQACYEEALFALLRRVHGETGLDAVALSGGCAMNSVANGKIPEYTPFRRVYVQPAAGDAGGALGAALVAWRKLGGNGDRTTMDHAYWGPEYGVGAITSTLGAEEDRLAAADCSVTVKDDHSLCEVVSTRIEEGKVVGWFQGRMEWGPRALGNRSILADPRRADMRDILNLKIKRREPFRPFAPSILEEAFCDWFEADEPDWFMTKVHPVRVRRRGDVPAITHVDGTGRPQAVRAATNPLYHQLIERFRERTGVPMVLNTSFNENEPIVCTPEEALDCFLRTKMDVVVLGHHFIERGRDDV